MSRLSDRAFHLLKAEVDCRYHAGLENSIERIVLLARLETLRAREGKPMTQIEIWAEVGDIAPDFSSAVLEKASAGIGFPLLSVSVSAGAIAALSAITLSVDTGQRDLAAMSSASTPLMQNNLSNAPTQLRGVASRSQSIDPQSVTWEKPDKSPLAIAKSFGWQAALKGKSPLHSARQWSEAAMLWRQAIAQLDQVSDQDADYGAAQKKKALYQQNLQQVEARQIAVLQPAPTTVQAPQFSSPREDWLATAKGYGWQAALASQNAPHPAQQWAEIAEVWEIALSTLDKIDSAQPQYAEAQQVKARYQQNLSAIYQRYQLEQTAGQQLQALQSKIITLDQAAVSSAVRHSQLQNIAQQLKSIPAGTQAHPVAQQLTIQIGAQMSSLTTHPLSDSTGGVVLSSNEQPL